MSPDAPSDALSRLIKTGACLTLMACGLSISACSTTQPAMPANQSFAEPIEGFDWFYTEEDSEVMLAYGMAQSDHIPMALSCQVGSGQVSVRHNVTDPPQENLKLYSGDQERAYAYQTEASPMDDSLDLTTALPSSDPVMAQFRSLGWLAVSAQGERHAYAATPASRAHVEHFFRQCEPS